MPITGTPFLDSLINSFIAGGAAREGGDIDLWEEHMGINSLDSMFYF